MARTGRPSIYSEDLATTICDRIAGGEFLRTICREPGMPTLPTVTQWVSRDREGFADRYWNARCAQAVLWSEDVLSLLDDAADEENMAKVQAARCRSDARKWLLSKLLAARFGDRLQLDQVGGGVNVTICLPALETDPVTGRPTKRLYRPEDDAHVIEGTARVLENGAAPEE
jgi:hypothetical protein